MTRPGKGMIFGECGTAGCTNTARWIPTSDIPVAPQPFIYRCPECCDRIDGQNDPTPGQPVEWVVSWCPTCLESTTWPVDLWLELKPRDQGHEHALAAV